MTIDEALAGAQIADTSTSAALTHLAGQLEADHNAAIFRLYPNAEKRSRYFLIPKAAVADVYKWTPDEVAATGLAGQSRYRVALPHGTTVQLVSISHHRVGEGSKAKKASTADDCACQGPDDGCPPDAPCVDDCDNCSNCCIA
jgi:hypothetical protein